MAKGRKLSTSRSERLLGSYAYSTTVHDASDDLREHDDDHVWSPPAENAGDQFFNASNGESTESHGSSRRRIPRRHVGGLSLAFEDSGGDDNATPSSTAATIVHRYRGRDSVASPSPRGHHLATSAPVNVPDWSKILRVESLHDDVDDGSDDNEYNKSENMVPPHEYLAREYARSRNSVFEGVGRTLKGRDLSRVRNAVWSQTGFDG